MDYSRLTYLFEKYQDDTASEMELDELFAVIGDESNREELLAYFEGSMREIVPDEFADVEKWMPVIARIVGAQPVVRRMSSWWRYAAAAVITLLVGLGVYYVWFNKKDDPAIVENSSPKTNDVAAPKSANAVIMLGNGERIVLDSVANGELARQGNTQLVKLADGKIVYKGDGGEVVYNTLSNPRGSQVIDMVLSDGSRVWLNAGSSITYPVAFVNGERKVAVTGEAYFEVAHNAAKPFKVSRDEMEVTVLGTHFNVNAYDDEEDIRVTLLEGSVSVRNASEAAVLKPGQQARVQSGVRVVHDVNTAQVMAWKNGMFDFAEGTSLKEIMKQVARWYDVEIVYEGNIDQQFGGNISRQVNVSKVLDKFELTELVHFKIEGKKIIVTP